MEAFTLLEIVGTETLAELRCVSMALGEPSVITFGTTMMPVLYAGNSDTLHMVSWIQLMSSEVSITLSFIVLLQVQLLLEEATPNTSYPYTCTTLTAVEKRPPYGTVLITKLTMECLHVLRQRMLE